MAVSNGGFVTDNGGWIQIQLSETQVDPANNRSLVHVVGTIINKGSGTSTHTSVNIVCSQTGVDNQGDSLAFNGPLWAIGVLGPGKSKVFFTHDVWCAHNNDGTGNANIAVHYGVTGTTIFGDNKGISANLTLTTLASEPTAPGTPVESNVLPTSLSLTWTAPSDNGGWPISSYRISQYNGDTVSGSPAKQYTTSGLTRNITGLTAGATYTFTVAAYNGHGANAGYSDESGSVTVQTLAGSWVRVDGVWHIAIPYVRVGGVWRMAVPYIRQGDEWKQTH